VVSGQIYHSYPTMGVHLNHGGMLTYFKSVRSAVLHARYSIGIFTRESYSPEQSTHIILKTDVTPSFRVLKKVVFNMRQVQPETLPNNSIFSSCLQNIELLNNTT
jgi:hypothetical protein